ncbi:hypothetical protein HZB07_06520 [Candidatus Saganbacteria bacterium]|nr:hypothetical protein [Candidatus Saganbacteria bacterium]
MKATKKDTKELMFYFSKLPGLKKVEALDYIKWLWVSPDEEFTEEEWKKIEKLSKQKGKTFDSWEKAQKHLKSMMK